MTKKVIAILSVLKPVNDTRNFEKIATSINNTNKYAVNIIGFYAKNIPNKANISFHAVFNFQRNSVRRLFVSVKIFKKLLKVKPELIIVTCPELLIVSILYKILFGCKVLYDIQENYYRNIRYTSTYPWGIRYLLAGLVRVVELIAYPLIDQYLLAESVYSSQMNYTLPKAIVIENKAHIPEGIQQLTHTTHQNLVFVYAGTIAEHYGIFDAIQFISKLKMHINQLNLTIIGYAPNNKICHKIDEITQNKDYIKITGCNALIPHNQILEVMKKSDFCLLPYQTNKSTQGRIPTKLYECLAMEKPVIITPNPAWDPIIIKNNAGIIHDFTSNIESVIEKLTANFYGNDLSRTYHWADNSKKLLDIIDELL